MGQVILIGVLAIEGLVLMVMGYFLGKWETEADMEKMKERLEREKEINWSREKEITAEVADFCDSYRVDFNNAINRKIIANATDSERIRWDIKCPAFLQPYTPEHRGARH